MKRQYKKVILEEISIYDLEGDIGIIEETVHRIKSYKNFDKIYTVVDVDSDPDEGYAILVFKGSRLETDKEYSERIASEAKKELQRMLANKNKNIKIK